MASRRAPGARTASVKEVRELSKLPWVRDEALSSRGMEARVLPDGRVLLYIADDCTSALYPSRESLAEVRRAGEEMMAKGRTIDLTQTLLPPIADFLRDAEAHAKSLGKAIRVPDEALDRTVESLDVAYKAVLRLRNAKRMTPAVFTPLTAYVGEVMRLVCDGQWTTSPPMTGHENEPMIRAPDGGLFQPFGILLVEITEHGVQGSLRGAVTGTLARYLIEEKTGSAG
jgi:hypothetical protein